MGDGPPVDFKAAMRRWASGVCVVTSAHDGVIHGLTVSGFISVSLSPPLVVVCLHERSPANRLIQASRAFAVNVLAAHQRDLSQRFAGRDGALDRFDGIRFAPGTASKCPVLEETLAALECDVRQCVPAGDHRLYIGEVVRTHTSDRDPLLYFRGDYREIIFGRRSRKR